MTLPYAHERAFAEQAALRAAILTKTVQRDLQGKVVSKNDKSPVTAADFASQALIIAALSREFPSDGFLGEEGAEDLKTPEYARCLTLVDELVTNAVDVKGPDGEDLARPKDLEDTLRFINMGGTGKGGPKGRFWVMDPVDGTRTFTRGQQYAVSLSLIEDGKEVIGILCCPALKLEHGRVREESVDTNGLGVMLTAVRGQGATVRTLSASKDTKPYVLPEAVPLQRLEPPAKMEDLHIVDSRDSTAIDHDVIQQLAAQVNTEYPGTEVWSSHMRYASLILGGADCQVRVPVDKTGRTTKVCIWDHAGAQLIFTEIGGKITDLDGKPMNFGAGRLMSENRGMIIAREAVHGDILKKVRDILGEVELES